MKHIIGLAFASALIGLSGAASWADPLSPAEAREHVGEYVTIEGVISQVAIDDRSGYIFLNYGGHYPNHVFYGIVFGNDASIFSDLNSLEGQTVALTGTVELYRGKPQIILSDPS